MPTLRHAAWMHALQILLVAVLAFAGLNLLADRILTAQVLAGRDAGDLAGVRIRLTQADPGLDAIFIGNSRVQWQINTWIMGREGFRAANGGVPGLFLSEFPPLLAAALERSPKRVVLSVEPLQLTRKLHCPVRWALAELPLLLEVRSPCLRRLRPLGLLQSLPLVQLQSWLQTYSLLTPGLTERYRRLLPEDDRPVSGIVAGKSFLKAAFRNGERFQLSHRRWPAQPVQKDLRRLTYDAEVLSYLRGLGRRVRAAGSLPVILIENGGSPRVLLRHDLEQQLGMPVLYMEDMPLQEGDIQWSKSGSHLSYAGSVKYSRRIQAALAALP